MALTRSFKETIKARAERDPEFRMGLFREAIEAMLSDDLETGKVLLRDYVNATMGFERLAEKLGKEGKSLHRMLGPKGNPRADNIFSLIKVLQDEDNITLHVKVDKREVA